MVNFYVSTIAQANGDHEVHKQGCIYQPQPENVIYLGSYSDCHQAIEKASHIFSQVDGCYYCCNESHTS